MNEWPLALRRVFALALLILLLACAWIYLAGPWLQQIELRQTRVEMLQRQLSGNRALLANEALIDKELRRLEQLGDDQALLFPATKSALAAADLRAFVGDIVLESGGLLVSVQEYEVDNLPGTDAIGLRTHLTGEAQNLSDILYALESARPAIFIDKLTVSTSRRSTVRKNRRIRTRAKSALNRRNSLDIRLDLSAYLVVEK